MSQKFKNYWLLIFVIFLLFLVIYVFYLDSKQSLKKDLIVAVLDVGQGDAIFIESPSGTQVLIDAGPPKNILNVLPKFLSFLDRKIDLAIITNPDTDHIAGFLDVLKHYKVEKIIYPGTNSDSDTFYKLEDLIKEKNIESILGQSGMRIDLGAGAVLDILFPNQDVSLWSNNDGSLVAKLSYGQTSVMFTGDATSVTEEIILKNFTRESLDVDILKVGHHGSRTSTTSAFLEALTPDHAIISLGKDNRYGHPHTETLTTLATFGVNVFRTDLLGTIIMKSDGKDETFSFIE